MGDKQITFQELLERIEKLKVNGLRVNAVGNIRYGLGTSPSLDSIVESQVRMTDPAVCDRVSVTLDIHEKDTEFILNCKLDYAEKLISKCMLINNQKEEEELINKKKVEALQAADAEMLELKKKSPILYDFLSSNLGLENVLIQMSSPYPHAQEGGN